MATTSYSNLFGTNGAGQQGSRAGISTLFGQQAKPQETEEERQQRMQAQGQAPQGPRPVQPQQTFAQLQKQGMARPAPQAPQAQPFAQFGGSQQAQQARTGMLGALQQQLAQPTRFDTQAFQQIRQAQASQLGAEYQAEQSRLNEELARRGLSASSIGGGRMGDLAGQQARALAQLDAQLLQQAAQTQAQDRLAALQAGAQFAELAGSQDLAQFEANRVAQAAEFQQALQQAQFGQAQTEFERGQALQAAQLAQTGQQAGMELALRERLGLGELTGRVGEAPTLAAQQQAEQRRQFDIQQALQRELGVGGLGIQEREVAVREQQLTQQAADTAAERELRVRLQEGQLTAQEAQQLRDIEARKALQTEQITTQQAQFRQEQAQRQAEAQTQQTGLSFIVGSDGRVVADIDPATMQQRTTAQAQQFQAQLNQQKELAAAELTGTITVNGQSVSTIAAQRLGQEGLQLALQQATQLSQQTGNVYEVNAQGQVVPKIGADGAPIRTESALARLSAEKLQQAELTGKYTDANGVTIDTIAAKQFDQNRLNALADQAARQSQLTGNMYTVNAQGQVVQETGADGRPVSTEARRAQVQQEANVARQIAQARADALSQQSGLSYTVNSNNEVVPDNDPATGNQRTTVQAQQLAAQTEQARLDRELRSRLGMGELTGQIDGRDTLAAQQQAFNQQQQQNQLFIQLAGILAQSGSTGTAGFLNQLMSALGVPNANIQNQQDTTADERFERDRFQRQPVTTPSGTTRTSPMTTTTTTTRTSPRRGG